jgi:phosphatidylserine/phosphatidylglycerophosphate/cardiolipin synthase-like enzyme
VKNVPEHVKILLNNIRFRNDTNPNYMHNKFCIIDDNIVTTGSFNPTDNDAYKNNNNLVIVKSKNLASNYNEEFKEMWSGTFGKGIKTTNTEVIIKNNITLVSLFCPDDHCSENIANALEKANESIYFMSFSFTDPLIANALVNMHKKNITIAGIIENNQANVQESRYNFLIFHKINLSLDQNKYFMHHKVFIIDSKIVVTGSMNPTNSGNLRNDENVLIIYDEDIAEKFVKEFRRLYPYPKFSQ